MDHGAVTIVIPTRDRKQLLLRTVRSVLNQEGIEVHVVVVDDGGADGSSVAVEALRDPRVRLIRMEEPHGVCAARNRGLSVVDTPWVAFLDDDDLFAPDKLRLQLESLSSDPSAGWSYVGAVFIDLRARIRLWAPAPPADGIERRLLARHAIPGGGSGVLVRTELARAVEGYDETLRSAEDWDFYIRLGLTSRAVAVDLPLLAYTVHAGSRSFDVDSMIHDYDVVTRKHEAERRQRGIELDRFQWLLFLATISWRSGLRRLGASTYAAAFRMRPSPRLLLGILSRMAPARIRDLKPRVVGISTPEHWRGTPDWLGPYRE